MISGRGLGATGGTLDKLEAIPGFRTNLTMDEVRAPSSRRPAASSPAPTADLVPADRKLYALRDATATVPSIPLITASIMSKKLAEGLDALVLDVKFGTGAFMKTEADARRPAPSRWSPPANEWASRRRRLLTDMNQPLGRMAGNAVEVGESIAALKGEGPADLMTCTLASARRCSFQRILPPKEGLGEDSRRSPATAKLSMPLANNSKTIDSGEAMEQFAEMVAAQDGDLNAPAPSLRRVN